MKRFGANPKPIKSVLALLLVLIAVAGCSSAPKTDDKAVPAPAQGSAPAAAPAPKAPALAANQDLILGMNTDIIQLDPTDIGDDPSSGVAGQIMQHLVERDKDGKAVGMLAEKWSTSDDALTWTFNLRKGVKFTDGSDFNADIVKWHYDRILTGKDAPTRFRQQFGDIIKEVKVVDPATVQFVLKAPNAAFLDLVIMPNGGMIPSKANLDKLGAKEAAVHPVGTGPFKFKEWVPGQRVVLEANADYWGEKTKLKTITFRPIPESNTQVIELETGGVHIIEKIGPEDYARLKKNPDVVVDVQPAYQIRFMEMNVARAPLNDVKVRQAVNYAIDAQGIVKSLVGDLGKVSESAMLPIASWANPPAGTIPTYKQDVAKAKSLLQEAGYTAGADGKFSKDGKPLKLTLISPNGRYPMDKEISEAIKNQLTSAGFTVDFSVMEWAAYSDRASKQHDFDMAFYGWNQSSPDPSLFFDAKCKTKGRGNYGQYSDPELDGWLTQAVAVTDQAKRTELYVKAAKRVAENAWYVPLYNDVRLRAYSKKVQGFVFSPSKVDYDGITLLAK